MKTIGRSPTTLPAVSAAFGVALLLIACGAPPAEESAAASSKIIEGTDTLTDHPSVGVLIDENGANGAEPHCTGTLIAPNLVITAAHCFTGPSKLTFQLGKYDPKGKTYEPIPSGSELYPYGFVHPSYQSDDFSALQHDLAYVILEESITDVTPAQIGSTDDVSDQCAFQAVGYGRTQAGPMNDFTPSLYQGERKMADICVTGMDDPTGYLDAKGSGGSTCVGDSGGGLLESGVSGDILVATVHGAPAGSTCGVGQPMWFQPLSTEADFVQKALADGLNPPSFPDSANAAAPPPAASDAPPSPAGDDDDSGF